MSLPNFLIIGPPRTGTTWIFRCLQEHPQVFVPVVKQAHFFDRNYDRGLAWYEAYFKETQEDQTAVGELTPDYFACPEAPDRIKETLGNQVKLIVIYRDPVERAFSEYRMKLRDSKVAGSFLDNLAVDSDLYRNSLYFANISRFLSVFPDDVVWVLPYFLLKNNPDEFIRALYQILDVPMCQPRFIHTRINAGASLPRSIALNRIVTRIRKSIELVPIGHKLLWKLRDRGVMSRWHLASRSNDDVRLNDIERVEGVQIFNQDREMFLELNLMKQTTSDESQVSHA